jgi:hypothetical protein
MKRCRGWVKSWVSRRHHGNMRQMGWVHQSYMTIMQSCAFSLLLASCTGRRTVIRPHCYALLPCAPLIFYRTLQDARYSFAPSRVTTVVDLASNGTCALCHVATAWMLCACVAASCCSSCCPIQFVNWRMAVELAFLRESRWALCTS